VVLTAMESMLATKNCAGAETGISYRYRTWTILVSCAPGVAAFPGGAGFVGSPSAPQRRIMPAYKGQKLAFHGEGCERKLQK